MGIKPHEMSDAFRDRVSAVLQDNDSNIFDINCIIKLNDNVTIDVNPSEISQLDINEKFEQAYRDVVEIDLDLSVEIYKQIYSSRQNIAVSLTIFDIDEGGVNTSEHVAHREYIGILKNKEDPHRIVPAGALDNTETETGKETKTVPVVLELIPENIYTQRKQKTNFILTDATIADTISFIAHVFGFKSVYVTPPDNTTTYKNMVVPPLHDISNIFDYLQNSPAYGVYTAGITHYIYNNVLYVLPLYRYNADGTQFNIYNVGRDSYPGLDNYHRITAKGIDIVTNAVNGIVSSSQEVIENIGNSYIVMTPHKLIDEAGTMASDAYEVNRELLTNITIYEDDAGLKQDSYAQTYIKSDNLFKVKSALAETNLTAVGLTWFNSVPFQVNPASRVEFIYDDTAGVNSMYGICSGITYTFGRQPTLTKQGFTCTSKVTLLVRENQDQ